jgi:hypothetical protein
MSTTVFGDPYLAWSDLTDFRGHAAMRRGNACIPLLIEADAKQRAALQALPLAIAQAWRDDPDARYFTALSRPDQLTAIEPLVEAMEFALPLGAATASPPSEAPDAPGLSQDPVIAVIDHGCACFNVAFRNATHETRLLALWDQGEAALAPWQSPPDFGYGRELSSKAINELLVKLAQSVNEAELYASLNYLLDAHGMMRDTAHGTHVLDTAGGAVDAVAPVSSAKPAQVDDAARAKLIFVDTPRAASDDTTGAANGAFLLDALRYIRLRAGPGVPVVVNISLGAFAGPHDGTSLVERAIDNFVERDASMVVTVAAGNAALERWHASGTVSKGIDEVLRWRTMPEDRTDSFVELWFDAPGLAESISIEVTPPEGGSPTEAMLSDGVRAIRGPDGTRVGAVIGRSRKGNVDSGMFLVAVGPSAGTRRMGPAGVWRIKVRNESSSPVRFDAWIQRDEPGLDANPLLVQSFFESSSAGVTIGGAEGGLSNLASGKQTIVVGAASREGQHLSRYSSLGGRSRRSNVIERTIDVAAPADESASAIGLLAAGVRSHTLARMGGTSVAAPVAARRIYDELMRANGAEPAQRVSQGSPPKGLAQRERDRLRSLDTKTEPARGDARRFTMLTPDPGSGPLR